MIEMAPGRVRRRLDKQPNVAQSWSWTQRGNRWEVAAGDETVCIEMVDGAIQAMEQLHCTCLLAPKCHHILACVTALDTVADASDGHDAQTESIANTAESVAAVRESIVVTPEMLQTAFRVRDALSGVLRVGARASGTLLQSALLRAGHECRVAGLPMLGNTVLRIAEGTRRLRAQSDIADSDSLQQDVFAGLLATELLSGCEAVPSSIVGTNRREYGALAISRLHGWFAEPILTRSGYAGVCIHLLAPDGSMHQITEVRTGDADLVVQAYHVGIELGATTLQGSDLCRKSLIVQNLSAAADGRLSKGKKTRWAVQGDADFDDGVALRRFVQPPCQQLEQVFRAANDPADGRRGGWDLIAFEAEVLGAFGPALLAKVDRLERPWRLRIAIDDPGLAFRDNLTLLTRCPGLRLRCVGRLRMETAGEVELLAIGPPGSESLREDGETPAPRLQLPNQWQGRCNLGIDRLQRHHIDRTSRWGVETVLDQQQASSLTDDGLENLDCCLRAAVLGGHRAVAGIETVAHRRAVTALRRYGYPTAVALIDTLASAAAETAHDSDTGGAKRGQRADFAMALLACATYLQAARTEFHRQRWSQLLD